MPHLCPQREFFFKDWVNNLREEKKDIPCHELVLYLYSVNVYMLFVVVVLSCFDVGALEIMLRGAAVYLVLYIYTSLTVYLFLVIMCTSCFNSFTYFCLKDTASYPAALPVVGRECL